MPRFSSLVNLLPQQKNFSCRSKRTSTAATKGAALRTPYVFTSNTLCLFLKDPMSLSQTPYVFSLKTCAPTRYTPVYPPDTHLCTHLIHTCVPKAPPPRYGTFEIGYGTLRSVMPDFPVRDTGLCQQRYPTFPSATFDRKTPVSCLKPSGSIQKPISVPKKSCFFSFRGH